MLKSHVKELKMHAYACCSKQNDGCNGMVDQKEFWQKETHRFKKKIFLTCKIYLKMFIIQSMYLDIRLVYHHIQRSGAQSKWNLFSRSSFHLNNFSCLRFQGYFSLLVYGLYGNSFSSVFFINVILS